MTKKNRFLRVQRYSFYARKFFFVIWIGMVALMMGALSNPHHDKSIQDNIIKPVDSLFVSVNTLEELQQHLEKAKIDKKPVMLEFYAAWCPSCRALDKEVFSTLSIQKLMRPFTNIRVDLTKKNDDSMQIVMYYQIYGTPSFIFYDKYGNEYNTDRFKNLDELKEVLIKLAD